MLSEKLNIIFTRAVDVVFAIILTFIVLGIAIGAAQLFSTTWELMKFKGVTGHYIDIISDVLTLYVLVELSRSLVEYFNTHKLRLSFIIDAAIVFTVREILIGLFKHQLQADMIYALSVFLLVLGIIRTSAVVVYQREKLISHE